ncbi:threonine/homoserine efflux transporter RhtA [Chitinophaga niastensis]|uniref:Threonine/homoserine efflux transporter RhtA n=1 Tax=Chitinophaga niastensis TaxID=536980 RepID=A0A2P8HCI6_CHINA|nr:DMT family transporter [Chitinophaga niastensis]PSL43831.1 threonine/homoserine efflux transporter RhtA [Chitinophaga niastensis]
MTRYILMVFAGACSFGILSTFVKLAYQEGFTAAEISVTQAFAGMLVLWIGTLIYGKHKTETASLRLKWAAQWPLLLTGAAMGLTTFVYYWSVRYIPASIAIVILMQFTWIGILLDWIFFKKKPGLMQLIITVIILAGTALASGLAQTGIHEISVAGILLAALSALLYAIYIIANSRVGRQLHPLKKSVIMTSGATLGIFIVNAHSLVVSTHYNIALLKWAAFLSLFGTIIPPVLFAKGIPKTGAGIAAIVMTAEMPVAVLCSHIILKEQVVLLQWIGITMMLLSIGLLHVQQVKK